MDRANQTKNMVLLVAYHYPPLRTTGAERSAKFARYLPEFGYDAKVLTTAAFGGDDDDGKVLRAGEALSAYRWLFNRQARRDPAAAARVRTESGPLSRWARGARLLMVPDAQVTWIPAASMRALQALRTGAARLIYSTYPPASAHLVALLTKQMTGAPWVADFRDSWTADPLDPDLVGRPHRLELERRLEAAVVGAADAVIASTRIAADYLRASHPDHADRIRVITNGFDPADLPDAGEGTGDEQPPPGGDGATRPLHLVHTGSFSVSHPWRSPQGLLTALRLLLVSDPSWSQRLQLTQVGRLTAAEAHAAHDLTESGMVRLVAEADRGIALRHQHRADVLLLVDHPRPWPASNLPNKLFEYLACRRPILALCTAGMVAETMAELQAGVCAAPDDPAAIAAAIRGLEDAFARGALHQHASTAPLHRFHRRSLTRQLAACFDDVLQRHNGTPSP